MGPTEGAFECGGSIDYVYLSLSDQLDVLEASGLLVLLELSQRALGGSGRAGQWRRSPSGEPCLQRNGSGQQ